jgi:glycosyltransferase involved in cell wall biosynthesis
LPANYGGFETLAEYLTKELADKFRLTVFCSSKGIETKYENYNGADLHYINLNANGVQSIPYDIISIVKALKFADTLLILGVSGCIVLPFVKMFSHKKIIVNIDGLEWKREKWNKYAKAFLKYSEKLAVQYADIVVTDNKVIQDYELSEYNQKSELIAYGGDHVTHEAISAETLKQFPFLCEPYAFKVCRIEPENNVHVILEAFSKQQKHPLIIIGNWNRSEYGKMLKEQYGSIHNLHLLDPIYDQTLLNELRSNCRVYVHGHSAGGTNPSLVEAMSLKLPVFAYDVGYNKETTENKACYFNDIQELVALLDEINDDELHGISQSMAEIATRRYRWDIIAQQYAKLF